MWTVERMVTIALAVLIGTGLPAEEERRGPDSEQIFEQLLSLEGDWIGKSTNGWESRITLEVIARKSAIVQTSHFEAHPGEKMVTVYHPDGDRLMVTHYCVAKNQPRLVATSWNDSDREATFTFLDGTNMSSRDQGHMDEAVIRFIDHDHFSSRWTWFQDGSEKWLETITYERVE